MKNALNSLYFHPVGTIKHALSILPAEVTPNVKHDEYWPAGRKRKLK